MIKLWMPVMGGILFYFGCVIGDIMAKRRKERKEAERLLVDFFEGIAYSTETPAGWIIVDAETGPITGWQIVERARAKWDMVAACAQSSQSGIFVQSVFARNPGVITVTWDGTNWANILPDDDMFGDDKILVFGSDVDITGGGSVILLGDQMDVPNTDITFDIRGVEE